MTVVLLHALAMSSAMWAEPRRLLEKAGLRVLAPDQRGHGTAPLGTASPSMDVIADDLAEILDEQRIDEITLVGCSMGGYLAMAFLRRHPGRVRALALLATRAEADDPAAMEQRLAFARGILDPELRPRLLEYVIPLLIGGTTMTERPEVVSRLTSLVHAVSPEALAWSQRAIAARPDSSDVLRALDVPSMVIAGEEDGLVTPADYRRLAGLLQHAELVTVPKAGHLTPLEAPAEVAAALTEFARRT